MIHVAPARPDQHSTALSVLFSSQTESERSQTVRELLEASRRGDISLDGLLLAEIEGKPAGAALYVLQPDKTAFVWPPVVAADGNDGEVCDAIYAELRRRVDAAGAWLSQCLVELGDTQVRSALSRNEFAHLADLCYLERLVAKPIPHELVPGISSVEFSPGENFERFASMIERTYVDTLDCPGLKGTRSGRDALESHQASGLFHPSRWKMYLHERKEIGLLLLNDQPDQDAWEVVYMGVVPEVRGHGYGRAIVIDGIRQVRDAGRRALLLAVDSRNTPAQNIYGSLGFREIARRAAHVRIARRR